MTTIARPLTVYLPDTRDVLIGRFGCGNLKLGAGVFTYSRIAGSQDSAHNALGSCPGATEECEAICYAKRIAGPVKEVYARNSNLDEVPPIPEEARVLRIHVSGDFDTPEYILNWIKRLEERPDVTCWAYTRSWRCHSLLEFLERLRALPNVQLFASMDPSTQELPPVGWRRAWIWRDAPNGRWPVETRLQADDCKRCHGTGEYESEHGPKPCMGCIIGARPDTCHNMIAQVMRQRGEDVEIEYGEAYVCPEETGRKRNCVACGYCFEGRKHDVVFLEH